MGGSIYHYLQTYLLEDIHEALEGAQSLDTIPEDPEDVLGDHLDVPDVLEDTPELMHL